MILFFYGSNTYEARQQIAKLIAQYEKKAGNTLGLERIEGAKVTLGALKASLLAVPFLANSRLVIIEQLGANKTVAPKVGELLAQIPATTVAVFYDPAVDQRTVYFKTLSATARAVEFKPLSQPQLQRWVERMVAGSDAHIDRPALGRLLEMVGEDQWRLSNEIAKLASHNPKITSDSVNSLVEPIPTETIFNLVEAMTAGQRAKALQAYHELRGTGQNEVYILSMVIWQLNNLLLAKTAGKISPPQLAKQAGMSPYVVSKMLSRRHLFTEEQLTQAFLEAVETEYQIKSGGGAAELLVEGLIVRLAGAMAKT
jgi:DNA polymerase III delta subunit